MRVRSFKMHIIQLHIMAIMVKLHNPIISLAVRLSIYQLPTSKTHFEAVEVVHNFKKCIAVCCCPMIWINLRS